MDLYYDHHDVWVNPERWLGVLADTGKFDLQHQWWQLENGLIVLSQALATGSGRRSWPWFLNQLTGAGTVKLSNRVSESESCSWVVTVTFDQGLELELEKATSTCRRFWYLEHASAPFKLFVVKTRNADRRSTPPVSPDPLAQEDSEGSFIRRAQD